MGAKCIIIFFGIDRRLDLTSDSILNNIVVPARQYFDVECVGHFWSPKVINNIRSSESGRLEAPRLHLLPTGQYVVETPGSIENESLFLEWKKFGDCWGDNFKSLTNLFWQLRSLDIATRLAMLKNPDIAVFVRPDLMYHDDFSATFESICKNGSAPCIYTPFWQPHGGLNDRFSIVIGRNAIGAYGHRFLNAVHFGEKTLEPINAEKLLRHVSNGYKIKRIRHRASRVRLDGRIHSEDFSYLGWKLTLRGLLGRTVPKEIKNLIRKLT